jgi:hypothetical protein
MAELTRAFLQPFVANAWKSNFFQFFGDATLFRYSNISVIPCLGCTLIHTSWIICGSHYCIVRLLSSKFTKFSFIEEGIYLRYEYLELSAEGKWNQFIQNAAHGFWEDNQGYLVLGITISKDCYDFMASSTWVQIPRKVAGNRMAACFRKWRHACQVYNVQLCGWRNTHAVTVGVL